MLSGFLITYLLLEEERSTGIQIGRFYLRRALRIWPLYYLTVFLALFVLPYLTFLTWPGFGIDVVHNNLLLKTALYGTLFANAVMSFVGWVPFATQAWSIGTEEQFYLIWPVLMKRVRNKAVLMLTFIALYLVGRALLSKGLTGAGPWQDWIRGVYGLFNFNCMVIGGLAGAALHKRFSLLPLLINQPVFYATLVATLALIARGVEIPYLNAEAYAIPFAVLILNFSSNDRIGWSMESEPFHYLGKISYGLYMLHPLAITASIQTLRKIGETHDVLLYPTCLLTTAGLSAISYRFIESPFLGLKRRFTNVVSGENARSSS